MAAFKQFNSPDIIVSPLEVNKSFTFSGDSELLASNVDINRFLGKNINFTSSNNNETGFNSDSLILSQSSVYDNIKQLYYSNYITSSFGDNAVTASVLLGSDPSGDVMIGPMGSNGRYINYLQSTLTQSRYFPTGSEKQVLVFSIPSKLYGDYIQPESFELYLNSDNWTNVQSLITDDGEGNLLSASINVGNIFYPHGIAVITQQDWNNGVTLEELYLAEDAIPSVVVAFSSSYTIYETQYKCTIDESEFNFSQNPSIISGSITDNAITSSNRPYDFATGSYFSPYVTTIGMYNEQYELLAVGKLAQPLPTSQTTDTTILVNIDR